MRLRLFALLVVPVVALIVLASLLALAANDDYARAREAVTVAELADVVADLQEALGDEALAAAALGGPGGQGATREERLDLFWSEVAITNGRLVAFEHHLETLPDEVFGAEVAGAIRRTLAFRLDVVEGVTSPLQSVDRYGRLRGLLLETVSSRGAALGSARNQEQIETVVALVEAQSAHLDERVLVDLALQYDEWAPGQHGSAIVAMSRQEERMAFVARTTDDPLEPSALLSRWRMELAHSEEVPELHPRSWSRASDVWLARLAGVIRDERAATLDSTLAAADDASNARTYTVGGVLLTLAAAALITAVVSYRLVKRVSIIRVQAARVSTGAVTTRIGPLVGGGDELAELASAFDEMTAKIETRTRSQWAESAALEAIAQGEPMTEISERATVLLGVDARGRSLYRFTDAMDPEPVPVDFGTSPADLNSPEVRTAIGLMAMARQRDAHHQELAWRASRDELTGLRNRAAIINEALHELGPTSALVYVDLDRFKEINDGFGHHAGDTVLVTEASRMDHLVGLHGGSAGRLGGDEFLLILRRVPTESKLQAFCDELVSVLSEPIPYDNATLDVGASAGAVIRRRGVSAPQLLNEADAALYEAKRLGRGLAVVSTSELRDRALEDDRLRQDLTDGLERGELVPWFQPIWSDSGQTLVGLEALARWRHPIRGTVSPAVFLPVAEELNLLPRLDARIFEGVCSQVAKWLEIGHDLQLVNYNLSAEYLESPGFIDDARRILTETGCPPEIIVAEVTETGLMTDIASNRGRLQQLRELGVRIAVDDFGQGYSSLAYLRELPIDLLKIDRQFVDQIDSRQTNQAIVDAVIGLGRSLNLDIVAEGVERTEELDHMASAGCDLFQGFLLARPMPVKETTALLGRRRPVTEPEPVSFFCELIGCADDSVPDLPEDVVK